MRHITDAGIRHSVGGSDYGAVRVGAFMGLSILSQASQPPFKAANGSTCGGDSQGQQLPILGKSYN